MFCIMCFPVKELYNFHFCAVTAIYNYTSVKWNNVKIEEEELINSSTHYKLNFHFILFICGLLAMRSYDVAISFAA